jgi:hypothetical protein
MSIINKNRANIVHQNKIKDRIIQFYNKIMLPLNKLVD